MDHPLASCALPRLELVGPLGMYCLPHQRPIAIDVVLVCLLGDRQDSLFPAPKLPGSLLDVREGPW